MADKKATSKIVLERTYNVPLRRRWLLTPIHRRAKRAASTLREFITKHMKATDVKIGKYANLELWKHGIRNPPHHIKVDCKKDEKGVVMVELVGAPKEGKSKKDKKAAPKADAKPAPKAAPKADVKADAKPEVKDSVAPKADAKPAEKAAPKEPAKVDAKTETSSKSAAEKK